MIKLSIITPYYNTLDCIKLLNGILSPQLTDEVEGIIIDDGCHEQGLDNLSATVIHLENNSGNASHPRNIGLDNAQGEYIVFIDSDDSISKDYISTILNKINSSNFDYCYFNWKQLNEPYGKIEITDCPPEGNCSIGNCIYKKNIIGDVRFDVTLSFAEDAVFNYAVRKGIKDNINKVLYYYNNGRDDSLTQLHGNNK